MPVRNGNLGTDRTTTTKAANVRNNWVRKIARVTRADRRRMVELREETRVQRSLTERLVRSRLQWAGHVERMADDIYTTKIDTFVCPPNISETVAVSTMKLAHRPRIASTTNKLISKQLLLSILSILLNTTQRISAGPKRRSSPPFHYGDSADFVPSLGHPAPGSGKTLSL